MSKHQNALSRLFRKIIGRPKVVFTDSGSYWEQRYVSKRNSGAGSYGRLAAFKAEVLNQFVAENNIGTVIEFGCGDGNQLTLAEYPSYVGVDVSPEAVKLCSQLFNMDESKEFFVVGERDDLKGDLTLSLDVIYHLVEDAVYERYMQDLFQSSTRYVIVYASNKEDDNALGAPHVRHRRFTDWVSQNAKSFKFVQKIENKFPFDKNDSKNTSFADFYFFEREA